MIAYLLGRLLEKHLTIEVTPISYNKYGAFLLWNGTVIDDAVFPFPVVRTEDVNDI